MEAIFISSILINGRSFISQLPFGSMEETFIFWPKRWKKHYSVQMVTLASGRLQADEPESRWDNAECSQPWQEHTQKHTLLGTLHILHEGYVKKWSFHLILPHLTILWALSHSDTLSIIFYQWHLSVCSREKLCFKPSYSCYMFEDIFMKIWVILDCFHVRMTVSISSRDYKFPVSVRCSSA